MADAEELGSTPAYLLASSIHTKLNGGSQDKGILDATFDLVAKGIPATLIAAGNEIANIPATIGNMFAGKDTYDITSTASRLADFDSNLADYYEDHKLGIDTAGFLVGSFVPGMAGVKILRAGPLVMKGAFGSGKMGALTSDALGLVVPKQSKYLEAAISQISTSGNAFRLGEANLLKALAQGVGEQALEGAAWTAMVNVTMNQSPVLDSRDVSDLTWDILTGAAIGGAVGGLFKGISSVYSVKKAFNKSELEVSPWTVKGLGGEPAESLTASDKILSKLQQLDALPAQDPQNALSQRIGRVAQQTTDALNTDIRKLAGKLAVGDQDIAHLLTRNISVNDFQKNLANLLESQAVTRVTVSSKLEREAEAAFKKAIGTDPLNPNAAAVAEWQKYKISYVSVRTPRMAVSIERPTLLYLADTATPSVVRNTVRVGDDIYVQNPIADIKEMNHFQAEARYHWSELSGKMTGHKDGRPVDIGINDIPMMQKAFRDGFTNVKIGDRVFSSLDEISEYTMVRQGTIAAELAEKKLSNEVVAKIVNADVDVLFGMADSPAMWNGRQFTRNQVGNRLGGDPFMLPSQMKILTKTGPVITGTDGNIIEGMAIIAQKEKIYQEAADRISARNLGELLPSTSGMKHKGVGSVTGATLFSAEGGNYGSWSSFFAHIGQRTHNIINRLKDRTKEVFTPQLQRLANSPHDALEYSVLNEQMRGLPGKYYLDKENSRFVYGKIPKEEEFAEGAKEFTDALDRYARKAMENEALNIPMEIPIKSPLVLQIIDDHIRLNGTRRQGLQRIHSNNNYPDTVDPDIYYPIPRNPKDTPHFAFVIDESVGATGHSKMIYAKDADTLEAMRNDIMSDPELRGRGIRVTLKGETEEYYKSIGQYEFERSISENYINTALARKGKTASFIPVTDPQSIANNFLEWHLSRDAAFVRTNIEHKYAKDFATFRQSASSATEAAKSKFQYISPLAYAESTASNPSADLIKMAMDISKVDEYPLWTPLNKFLDTGFSKLVDTISTTFGKATHVDHIGQISESLKQAGYTDVINADLLAAANATIPRGKLTTVVNNGNAIIAAFALRSDPLNAINNSFGSAVTLGPEFRSIMRYINSNPAATEEFNALAKIKTPGTGDLMLSPAKLFARRIGMFHTDLAGRAWAKENGFSTSITDQYMSTLDNIGSGIMSGDNTFMQKAFISAKSLGDTAEKWSGNKLAEEMLRYAASGAAKDVTDIAIKHGLIDPQLQLSMINTFVNRTQGNYLASQRPVIFQGPLGQAMGLFQTYQFNLLQQVFRHIGDGSKKELLTIAGLQGGIYGMNGMPAFNAINTYVIGQAGGNTEHKNLYDAIFSGAGKEAGEWLLYGGLSNGLSLFHPDLKTNIYSRGDINPRHITLIPVDPRHTPIFQASARMFTNIKDSLSQVAMGADVWGTFLRGVEQNGISRPLTGMAQLLSAVGRDDGKVISTNQSGQMLMAHDLYSLTSLMRIAGGKPLDEAMVNDQMFRIDTYRKSDSAKRKTLAEGVRTSIKNGDAPSPEQVGEFAYQYARTGGKQPQFAAFMAHQYTAVSVSKAEKLRSSLSSPYSKSLQILMNGGEE